MLSQLQLQVGCYHLYTAQSNGWGLTVHEGRTMQPLVWHLTVLVHFLRVCNTVLSIST